MSASEKEKFDWRSILSKTFVTALAGIMVAWVGVVGNWVVSDLASQRESARMITQLQLNREQADIDLRKDVFDQALKAFFLSNFENDGSLKTLSKQLLTLELLALNFGDSLSLSPLFKEFYQDIRKATPGDQSGSERTDFDHAKKQLQDRLIGLARRVASVQVTSLSSDGEPKPITVNLGPKYKEVTKGAGCFASLYEDHTYKWPHDNIYAQWIGASECDPGSSDTAQSWKCLPIASDPSMLANDSDRKEVREQVENQGLIEFKDRKRRLEVLISNVDHCQETAKVQFLIYDEAPAERTDRHGRNRSRGPHPSAQNESDEIKPVDRSFTLDFFNFPKIDNTRLSGNHRFAIVMDDFIVNTSNPRIELIGVVFSSEFASLRDKTGVRDTRKLLESALAEDDE